MTENQTQYRFWSPKRSHCAVNLTKKKRRRYAGVFENVTGEVDCNAIPDFLVVCDQLRFTCSVQLR